MDNLKEKVDFHSLIRVIAGGYLIYLGYNMIKGVLAGDDPGYVAIYIIAAIAFIAIGAALVIIFLIKLMQSSAKDTEDEDEAVDAIIDGETTADAADVATDEEPAADAAVDSSPKEDESE